MDRKLAVFAIAAAIAIAAFFVIDNSRSRYLCGDGSCSAAESCSACPSDCGRCPSEELFCGDGYCNSIRYDLNIYSTDAEFLDMCVSDPGCLKGLSEKEDCFTCPTDCGGCVEDRCPDGTPKSFWESAIAQYKGSIVASLDRATEESNKSMQSFPKQHFTAPNSTVRKAAKVLYSLQYMVFREAGTLRAWLNSCNPGTCWYYSECVLGTAEAYNLLTGSSVAVVLELRPNMTHCLYSDTDACLSVLWPKAASSLESISGRGFEAGNISDSCPLFSEYNKLKSKLPQRLGDRMMLEQKLAMASGWNAVYETLEFGYETSMEPITEQDKIGRIVLAEQIIYLAEQRESLAAAGC